jgi:aryl-alcohol dehydrogenase-like predicted oxidoreductase
MVSATSVGQLAEITAAAQLALDSDALALLEEASRPQ